MRAFIVLGILLTHLSIWAQSYQLKNPDAAIRSNFENIDLIHVDYGFEKDTADVEMGQSIGKVSPYPEKYSERFHNQILQSRNHYNTGNFEQAFKVLEKAYKQEPNNNFIIEAYARALYQIDSKRGESYQVYLNLITKLDNESGMNDSTLTIDFWFREAYWKLGTLYMDNGEWIKAFEDISRFVLSIQESKGTPIYDYALAYLTECAFEMGQKELCQHFANRTLFYNPANEQVKYYLKQLKN